VLSSSSALLLLPCLARWISAWLLLLSLLLLLRLGGSINTSPRAVPYRSFPCFPSTEGQMDEGVGH
jgi:hypothetical protein